MCAKVIPHSYTIKKICPSCKREVNAIKLNIVRNNIKGSHPPTIFQILGCPLCQNVFYYEED